MLAIEQFAIAVEELHGFLEQFSKAFMAAAPPSRRRRWQRDLARAQRRPSLIHNGRKPR